MDPRLAATPAATVATSAVDPDAIDFVRFCHRRRRVGWPELYDEMCAVAARGLYRGYSADDLATHGIRFGLFDMPALAALTREVVAAEVAARRPVQVAIRVVAEESAPVLARDPVLVEVAVPIARTVPMAPPVRERAEVDVRPADVRTVASDGAPAPRFQPVPAGV